MRYPQILALALALIALGSPAWASLSNATRLNPSGVLNAWGLAQGGGYLYVSDGDTDEIAKFDATGILVARFGGSGSGAGNFHSPNGLAFGPDGHLYVADFGNHRIQVLDSDGTALSSFGSYGSGPGQFTYPSDVAFGLDGRIYVADSHNSRVCAFSSEGAYQAAWGSLGAGALSGPMGLGTGPDGSIYVADTGNGRVVRYSPDGDYLGEYGQLGSGQGRFGAPMDVVVDSDGLIYVADTQSRRVQVLNTLGAFEGWWGEGDGGASFTEPYALGLSPDGRVLLADGSGSALYALPCSGDPVSNAWFSPQPAGARNTTVKPERAPRTGVAVGPVPSRPGQSLCVLLPQAPRQSRWDVYSIDGRPVASVEFSGQASQCWSDTASLATGVYIVKLANTWADGSQESAVQKLVIEN